MNRLRFVKVKSERFGFTLIEAVVSLIVIAMGLLLISFFLNNIGHGQQNRQYTEIHFYSYLKRFEAPDYRLIQVLPSQLLLEDCHSHKKYRIRIRKKILLLSGINNKGYVPLISDVDSIHWSYHHHSLRTSIIMTDQSKYQASSFIELRNN